MVVAPVVGRSVVALSNYVFFNRLRKPQQAGEHRGKLAKQAELPAGHFGPVDRQFDDPAAEALGQCEHFEVEEEPRLDGRGKDPLCGLAAEHLETALGVADREPQHPPRGGGKRPTGQPAEPRAPAAVLGVGKQTRAHGQIGPRADRRRQAGLLFDGRGPVGVGKQPQSAGGRQHAGPHGGPLAAVLRVADAPQLRPVGGKPLGDNCIRSSLLPSSTTRTSYAAGIRPVEISPDRRKIRRQTPGLIVGGNDK